MKDLSVEYQRAIAGGAKMSASFGKPMRGEMNNFEDGDVILFPELKFEISEDGKTTLLKKDGSKVIVSDELKENGKPTGQMMEFMFVTIKRNGTEKSARFFPSLMWKRRDKLTNKGTNDAPIWESTKNFVTSDGAVVEFARNYTTVDEAVYEISKKRKGILFKKNPLKTYAYGTTNVTDDFVATLEWAD